jgi:uncharacterized membrane protein
MFTKDGWDPDDMMNGSYGNGFMGGGAWMMLLVGLLLVVLLATTIFFVLKAVELGHQETGRSADRAVGSPRDVLDHRLARGEISHEEYAATRTLLDP